MPVNDQNTLLPLGMGYILKHIKCKHFHLKFKPTANGKKKTLDFLKMRTFP